MWDILLVEIGGAWWRERVEIAVGAVSVEMKTDLGYRVLEARDAESALGIVESGIRIDVLFTDVVMPGRLKSTELARKARALHPALAGLFTSGYTENSIVHGGRLDPGVHLLGKPYTREALALKIRQLLGAASAPSSWRIFSAEAARKRPLSVLLCEDDEGVRLSLAELLESLDCQVVAVATASAASAALLAHRHDLLITDLGLPDEAGLDLAAWARARQPELALALASGHHTPDVAATASRTAGSASLSKGTRASSTSASS
eukprot:gene17730-biopygen5167